MILVRPSISVSQRNHYKGFLDKLSNWYFCDYKILRRFVVGDEVFTFFSKYKKSQGVLFTLLNNTCSFWCPKSLFNLTGIFCFPHCYRFWCTICGRGFKRNRNLRGHMETHNTASVARYDCHICGRSFSQKESLNGHLWVHRKKMDCDAASSDPNGATAALLPGSDIMQPTPPLAVPQQPAFAVLTMPFNAINSTTATGQWNENTWYDCYCFRSNRRTFSYLILICSVLFSFFFF